MLAGMDAALSTIPMASLLVAFAPSLLLLAIMHRWSLKALGALYANVRMLVQLLAVGYVLTYVFETDQWGIMNSSIAGPLQPESVAFFTVFGLAWWQLED